MKKKEGKYAIYCDPKYGRVFGMKGCVTYPTIQICDRCNVTSNSYIGNNSFEHDDQYEYHSEYICSLFVNTSESYCKNFFSVLDYEVFCIDNYKDYIFKKSKYPNILWEYIETQSISEESLMQFDDDIDLLKDLDVNHYYDNEIRLLYSRYCLKNPSELLSTTQIVNKKYDPYLRKWLESDSNWKLLYRASEHKYSASLFHKYCDDKGPTLVIIKSREGWIFGGYTTQSWKSTKTGRWDSIYFH